MNLTVTTIAKSLADYLAPCFPSVAFYEDPNQQGSRTPCPLQLPDPGNGRVLAAEDGA